MMHGTGISHGAISVMNAIPFGVGATIGIDLKTEAVFDSDNKVTIDLIDRPGLSTKLAETCDPTVGNHVIIGAGAKVLGDIIIADYVRIGAGSVVIEDVPSHSTVVGVPGRIVQRATVDEDGNLMHNKIPNPVSSDIENLRREIEELRNKIG